MINEVKVKKFRTSYKVFLQTKKYYTEGIKNE